MPELNGLLMAEMLLHNVKRQILFSSKAMVHLEGRGEEGTMESPVLSQLMNSSNPPAQIVEN